MQADAALAGETAEMRRISPGRTAAPATRRTGVSIEIAPTGTATRASGAPATAASASASGEGGAARRQRHQRQAAQLLGAIALVVVEVAFVLHQHPAAASREQAERKVVGQGAGRHEHRRLLAEQRRHPRFEFADDAVARISSTAMPRVSAISAE